MQRTAVINVVGLTRRLIGTDTPFLLRWSTEGSLATIDPVLPAVTCSAQATYLTGKMPSDHGIVANGWYFRDECEVKLWRQSNKLVQASKIWDHARTIDPSFTCANLFWWYNMYSTVDYSVTPRPMYPADGLKLPDIYTQPASLRDDLQQKLGTFPLFEFWGPATTIRSSDWIARSAMEVEEQFQPSLSLVYLPHLDYNLQRLGPEDPAIATDLHEIDTLCETLITFYESRGIRVTILSEYGISAVSKPVHLNRVLREHGFIALREERGLELLDAGASAAFALADHQLAHIYVNDPEVLPIVKTLIEKTTGVAYVLDAEGKKEHGLAHDRAGELVAVSEPDAWFTYYYWMDDARAPDFARTVDIHRKPGYDPVELFVDPNLKVPKLRLARRLAQKKLGFRYLMDVIPLDATLVKGSHGHLPADPDEHPVFITQQTDLLPSTTVRPTAVHDLIMAHMEM